MQNFGNYCIIFRILDEPIKMKPHENRYLKVENFNFRDYYKVIKLKEIEWQIKHQYYGMKDRKFEATVAGLEKDRSNSLNFIDLLRELTGELLKLILDCVSSTDYARKFVSHLVRISTLAENAFKEDLFEPGEEIKIDLMFVKLFFLVPEM